LLLISNFAIAGHTNDEDGEMRRKCPEFVAWSTVNTKRRLPAIADPALGDLVMHDDLLRMMRADQDARSGWDLGAGPGREALHRVENVDADNLVRMKVIVALYGFPARDQIGSDGVFAAWLLIQHADADPDLQAFVLEQIEPRVNTGEVSGAAFALLTDRVLLAMGKPQRYGSQFFVESGKQTLRPTEDVEHVDQRRKNLGLPPLAYYMCALRVFYGRN
jgi:hypothetical protein